MVEQRHQIGVDPREEAVTGKAVSAAYAGSIGRDHAEAQRSSILVGRADIMAADKPAVAVHHGCPVLVPVQRVPDAASVGKCQLVITQNTGHAETLLAARRVVLDGGAGLFCNYPAT